MAAPGTAATSTAARSSRRTEQSVDEAKSLEEEIAVRRRAFRQMGVSVSQDGHDAGALVGSNVCFAG
jgi:hypothetical protein